MPPLDEISVAIGKLSSSVDSLVKQRDDDVSRQEREHAENRAALSAICVRLDGIQAHGTTVAMEIKEDYGKHIEEEFKPVAADVLKLMDWRKTVRIAFAIIGTLSGGIVVALTILERLHEINIF